MRASLLALAALVAFSAPRTSAFAQTTVRSSAPTTGDSSLATSASPASTGATAPAAPIDSTVGLCASTSPRRWCWGIFGGATAPMGSYSRYAGVGLHAGLLLERVLTPRWRVCADASYQGLHAKDNGSGAVFFEPNVRMGTLDAIWEAVDEHAGLLHPYLSAGVGFYQLRLVQTCWTDRCTVNYSGTSLAGGVNAGLGVRLVFPGHWNRSGFTAFAEARWHGVAGAVSPYDARRTAFVPLSIGFLAR